MRLMDYLAIQQEFICIYCFNRIERNFLHILHFHCWICCFRFNCRFFRKRTQTTSAILELQSLARHSADLFGLGAFLRVFFLILFSFLFFLGLLPRDDQTEIICYLCLTKKFVLFSFFYNFLLLLLLLSHHKRIKVLTHCNTEFTVDFQIFPFSDLMYGIFT